MGFEESNLEIPPNHSASNQKVKEALLEQYKKLNTDFEVHQNKELLYRMLLRLLIKKVIPARINRPLYLAIIDIIDELMLSELEFALWAIYLERVSWSKIKGSYEEILNFTAFKAKSKLDESEPYFTYLCQKFPNFKLKYQKWIKKNRDIFDTSIADINKKYKELTAIANLDKELESINFAFFSESIMRSPELAFEDKVEFNESILKRSSFDFQSNQTKKQIINDETEEWTDITPLWRSSSIGGSTASSEENDYEVFLSSSSSSYFDCESSISKKDNF